MILWTLLCGIIALMLLWKTFQKLTCGICKSGAHMLGKVVIITGGNSGIGLETAKNLAERGAKVIIACRSLRRGEEARDEIIRTTSNKEVYCKQLDLASFKSIRDFVDDVEKTEKRLDVLINNAGAGGLGNRKTVDGNHIGMQVNFFGPLLLTKLLLPLLKLSAPSRIINVSSALHKYAEMDFDNLNMEKYWSDYLVYANSKLYLNLITLEFSKRLAGTGVTVNALHPGVAATNLFRNMKNDVLRAMAKFTAGFFFQTVWEASQTSIYLAVAHEVKDLSGLYFSDCRVKEPSRISKDPTIASQLWEESEKILSRSFKL